MTTEETCIMSDQFSFSRAALRMSQVQALALAEPSLHTMDMGTYLMFHPIGPNFRRSCWHSIPDTSA
jgi:hypothetical protein